MGPALRRVRRPLSLRRATSATLLAQGELTADVLSHKKDRVRECTRRSTRPRAAMALGPYREGEYDAYLLGDVVEKL